ncbi:MAG: hypothetical protein M3O41_01980 [Pseudomonadota bacterium]|nr:hypothetical protein [Pseudomonadota bacterium]
MKLSQHRNFRNAVGVTVLAMAALMTARAETAAAASDQLDEIHVTSERLTLRRSHIKGDFQIEIR